MRFPFLVFLISFFICGTSKATDREILNMELRNLCNKNHYESCAQLGLVYVETDPKRSIPFFLKACDGGRAESCWVLARIYETKIADLDLKIKFGIKACDLGQYMACQYVGLVYSIEFGDDKTAIKYLEKACSNKVGEACFHLGSTYKTPNPALPKSKEPNPQAKMVDAFKKGCELKDLKSCEEIKEFKTYTVDQKTCNKKMEEVRVLCRSQDCTKQSLGLLNFPECNSVDIEIVAAQVWSGLEESCSLFKQDSCHEIAGYYWLNKLDPIKAISFSQMGCENKNIYSCAMNDYLVGSTSRDAQEVLQRTKRLIEGCLNNKMMGPCQLSYLLLEAQKSKDTILLTKIIDKGCSLNSPILCQVKAKTVTNKDEKIEFLERACNADNFQSCLEAGSLLKDGNLLDKYKALKLYRKSCYGHSISSPVEFGCADATIIESQFYNMIPSDSMMKYSLYAFSFMGFLSFGLLGYKVRKNFSKVKALEKDYIDRKTNEIREKIKKNTQEQ